MSIMAAGRARDFAIYIAIAVTFVVAIAWASMHSTLTGAEVFGKWGGLVANTFIIFGYTIRYGKRYWKRPSFWTVLLGLLSVHIILFLFLLERLPEWRISWWILVTPVEYIAIGSLLALFGFRGGNLHRS